MADIDMEDPTTWPEDEEAMQALVTEDSARREGDNVLTLAGGGTPEESQKEEEPSPKGDETPPEDETQEKEDPGTTPETEEEPKSPQKPEEIPIQGVATKDGKHIIPFAVVEGLRKSNKELKVEMEALRAEMAQKPEGDPEPTPMWAKPAAEIKTYVDKIREEYGDAVADQEQRILGMESREAHDKETRETEASQHASQQEKNVQSAVEATPKLMAWQMDTASPYYGYAQSMHSYLQNNDPDYAQLSTPDQMGLLVGKVEAVHGESPHQIKAAPAPAAKTPPLPKAKDKPTSISDIPGGAPPETDPIKKLSKMSDSQMMGMLENLNAEESAAFLRSVM